MRAFVVAFSLLCSLSCGALADDTPASADNKHGIREPEHDVSSRIKRLMITTALPPEKTYAELTPEEKALTKAPYDHMAIDDEPPYPLHGEKELLLAMHDIAESLQVRGDLSMIVNVNSQGDAVSVEVLASPDKEFTQYVASALMLEKYKPALCDHKPCALAMLWKMHFSMHYL